MMTRVAVPSADFIRNIGRWQNEALRQPIWITHHGRERLVLAAPDQFKAESDIDPAVQGRLAALQAEHAALLDQMEEGCLGIDAHLRIVALNGIALSFLGCAREDAIGASVHDVFPELLALILADRVQRVARARRPERFESEALEGRHLSVRVFPVGEAVMVMFQNITEQQRMRREAEESVALVAAIARQARIARMKLDSRGRILAVDEIFASWTGFRPEDLIGHRFAEVFTGAERRETGLIIDNVLRDGQTREARVVLLGKRGDPVACELAIAPILSDFVPRGAMVTMIREAGAVEQTAECAAATA